jgi:hypothetical protein
MGKIVGEAFANEMVLLQRAKRMLKDRLVWYYPECFEKLSQAFGTLSSDTQ